jgi:hypothetical protein
MQQRISSMGQDLVIESKEEFHEFLMIEFLTPRF